MQLPNSKDRPINMSAKVQSVEVFSLLKYSAKLVRILKTDHQTVQTLAMQACILLGFVFNFSSAASILLFQRENDVRKCSEAAAFTISYGLMIIWYLYALSNQIKLEDFFIKFQELINYRKYNIANSNWVEVDWFRVLFQVSTHRMTYQWKPDILSEMHWLTNVLDCFSNARLTTSALYL